MGKRRRSSNKKNVLSLESEKKNLPRGTQEILRGRAKCKELRKEREVRIT